MVEVQSLSKDKYGEQGRGGAQKEIYILFHRRWGSTVNLLPQSKVPAGEKLTATSISMAKRKQKRPSSGEPPRQEFSKKRKVSKDTLTTSGVASFEKSSLCQRKAMNKLLRFFPCFFQRFKWILQHSIGTGWIDGKLSSGTMIWLTFLLPR